MANTIRGHHGDPDELEEQAAASLPVVDANAITPRTVRLYGANELGVLSLTAAGDAHPRVRHLGGDLFAGLDDQGAATTEREAGPWIPSFPQVLDSIAQQVAGLPAAADGVLRLENQAQAVAALLYPERIPTAGLRGVPIVFALARNRVLIVGADDETAVPRVLDAAEELFDAEAPLVSAHPVVRADRVWDRFDWLAAFPGLDVRIQRVLRLFGVRAYTRQGQALSDEASVHVAEPKLHTSRESGIHQAPHKANDRPEGTGSCAAPSR